jgi:hypothetical protein
VTKRLGFAASGGGRDTLGWLLGIAAIYGLKPATVEEARARFRI